MRKWIYICLILVLFCGICGCANENNSDTVTFYYPRNTYQLDESGGVIAEEKKEFSKHALSPEEIIAEYLKGTNNSELCSPLSGNAGLLHIQAEKSILQIIFSDSVAELSPTELIPSLAALAMTCFEVFPAEEIRISAETVLLNGEHTLIFTKDNILLWDSCIESTPATQPTANGE